MPRLRTSVFLGTCSLLLPAALAVACGSSGTTRSGTKPATDGSTTESGPDGTTSGDAGPSHEDAARTDSATGGDGPCSAIGATCSSKAECCSLYCKEGSCACNGSGYECQADVDCCSGLGCGPSGTCVPTMAFCQPCDVADASPDYCGPNAYCVSYGLIDPAGYCAQSCGEGTTGTCQAGFTCQSLSLLEQGPLGSSACLPNGGTCEEPDGGTYCTITCDTVLEPNCPCPGYTCQPTALGEICLSSVAPVAALCDPCTTTSDCPADYFCVPEPVDSGLTGSFCAPSCSAYSCPAPTVCDDDNPLAVSVCYPKSGSCADGGG